MSELVRFLSGDNDVAQKTQMDPQNPTAKFVPLEPGQVLFGLEVVEDGSLLGTIYYDYKDKNGIITRVSMGNGGAGGSGGGGGIIKTLATTDGKHESDEVTATANTIIPLPKKIFANLLSAKTQFNFPKVHDPSNTAYVNEDAAPGQSYLYGNGLHMVNPFNTLQDSWIRTIGKSGSAEATLELAMRDNASNEYIYDQIVARHYKADGTIVTDTDGHKREVVILGKEGESQFPGPVTSQRGFVGDVDGNAKSATKAKQDWYDQVIDSTYLSKIVKTTHNGSKFEITSYDGRYTPVGSADAKKDVITIPGATTTLAGLVTTGDQTITGNKTINSSGTLTIMKQGGFIYSGIQEDKATNKNLPIWFSTGTANGTPNYSTELTYNPSTGTVTAKKFAGPATSATYDAEGGAIHDKYLKRAGGTMTGALKFADNIYNAFGDDVEIGSQNAKGKLNIHGKNGATGIVFVPYSGSTSQTISIDGAGVMTITGTVKTTLKGNADTATKLKTARNFNITDSSAAYSGPNVSFDGSADITLHMPDTFAGTLKGNSDTATKLKTARTLWGQSFNGTANISGNMSSVGNVLSTKTNTYTIGSSSNVWKAIYATAFYGALSGNASSATKLETARSFHITDSSATYNGANATFNGTGDITLHMPSTFAGHLVGNADNDGNGVNIAQNYMRSEMMDGNLDAMQTALAGKTGRTGSINLTKKASGTGSQVPAGWYNYIFSPHRTGIGGGDNDLYGTTLIFPMTFSGNSYIVRRSSSKDAAAEVKMIIDSGNISKQSVDNADKVDGYHASSLWRSDGAVWNPGANVSMTGAANGQEWSFDIHKGGMTGLYWQVWEDSKATLLKVDADTGKVSAPYGFVGNVTGNASSATKLQTARKIWGQNFDGTADVTGNFTMSTGDQINMTSASHDGFAFNYNANKKDANGAVVGQSTRFYDGKTKEIVRFDAAGNVGIGFSTGLDYRLKVNGTSYFNNLMTVNKVGTAAVFGGILTNISSSVYAPTAGIQLCAAEGGATNSTAIGFHNPGISSSAIGYYNIDANHGNFRFISDDTYWSVLVGGSTKLSNLWNKANIVVGADGADKIVIGNFQSTIKGATIGAQPSALGSWAPLHVAGTSIHFYKQEVQVAKMIDGCLSLYPQNSSFREGIRIHSTGSWSDILLCGNDATGDSGTSANSWFIGNNNGNFYLTRNGSDSSTASYLRSVSNVWNMYGAKFTYTNGDSSLAIYPITNVSYGSESIGIQTCFDGQDPATSAYVTSYENRCNLLLQPRGGQTYIGWNPEAAGNTAYSLLVGGDTYHNGAIEISGVKSAASYATSEGAFSTEYANIILRGDATYGISGIVFTSAKHATAGNVTTSINQTSDKAFIQFKPYGVNSSLTNNSSGEANKLIIGVGNDADDMIYMQTPAGEGLKHVVGTNVYTIADYGNAQSDTSLGKQFVKVFNSNLWGGSGTVTMTDIAKKCMAVGMIYAATDNPNGNAASWNHVLNLGWGNTEASWNSQLAFGVGNNDGAYYRLNSGNLVGTRWRALEEVQFVQSASMRILAKNHEFRKISGGDSWNAEVRSQNSYTSDCYISFRAGQINKAIMVGFAQDPAIDASYTSLNYCIYLQNNGVVSIYESGSAIGSYGSYVAHDEFRIEYVDNQINYYHNQKLLLSRKNVGQRKLFFDSSFHGQGGYIYDTYFGKNGKARSVASSWIDGQRYMGAALNINDATDTGSYWPWLRQTNTAAGRWFSLGQLSHSVYLMSSPTSSTTNGYTFGWRFDGSNGDTVFNDSGTRSSARTRINGRLVLNPYYSTTESYSEGLRINKSNNGWAILAMGGANGTEAGTGTDVWLLGVNGNTFYLSNNGSNSATYRMQAENTGHFRFYGAPGDANPILDVVGQSAPAAWNYGIVTRVGSLTAGKHIYNPIGVNYSTRNMVGLDFYYAGSGSTSNYLGFEIIGAGNAARFYCDKHAEFYNHAWLKYATPSLYLMDTNTAADTYSIIRFGTTNSAGTGNQNAAYIFLNGPARTSDGGANLMTIRNNVGNLRLNNSTYVTGSLTVGQDSLNTSYKLYVNGTSYLSGNANVCKVYNTANYGDSSSVTLTQLAAYNNASCGMIHAATDNPRGAAGWVHVWSQAWQHGVTSSWVSQIALNVNDGAGMWYRTTSGNIAGRAWIRVLDTNNYASVLDSRYVNATGDTMTGLLSITTHGVTTTYGCQNASYNHFSTTASVGHWFNKNVYVQGNIYAGSSYSDLVLTTANYASQIDSRYVNVTGDTMTGDLRVPQLLGNTWVRANYNASGTDGGLTLYGSDVNYGIIFRTTANCGTHGWVNGDWATYFTMSNTSGRGWVFRRWGSGNVASISTDGNVNFNGALYCGNYIQTNQRIICGYDSGVQYSVSCSGWFRSSGNSGWYNASHNVGIYADNSTYLKSYEGKIFHSSRGILADPTVYYGINSLQYFNVSTSTTSGATTAAVNPYNDWFYHIRMNHANGGGYYGDQAWCFHSNSAYYRRVVNGVDQGWVRIWLQGNAVTGAVWNDYAEYRQADTEEAGYVLYETGKDDLKKTTERLQHFAGVSSDTWGFSQGETEKAKTPIAVAGRVLVYPYQDRDNYQPGDCVCAAPGGTVDIMTREEVAQYPDRIVGTVSCVPDYEEWGGGELADRDPVKVNGRIWIKVR